MTQRAKSEAVSVAVAQPVQKVRVALEIGFYDEICEIDPEGTFTIDRVGTPTIEDNPFLCRNFLVIESHNDPWWVSNVDSRIAMTVTETTGVLQSWIGPGSQIPLVVPSMSPVFTVGPTMYEIDMTVPDTMYEVSSTGREDVSEMTMGRVMLTPSQRLLALVLAKSWLRRVGIGPLDVLRSEEAAQHPGWTQIRFDCKLDNAYKEPDGLGARGLCGGKGVRATYHRARLVEYAVASQLVTADDPTLLDEEFQTNQR